MTPSADLRAALVRIARRLGLPPLAEAQVGVVSAWAAADPRRAAGIARYFEFSAEYTPDGQLVSDARYCLVHLPADVTAACLAFGNPVPAYDEAIAFHRATATFGVGAASAAGRPRHKLYVIHDGPTVSYDPGVFPLLAGLTGVPATQLAADADLFGHRMKGYGLDEADGRIDLKLYHGLISLAEVRERYAGLLGSAPLEEIVRRTAPELPVLICSRWGGSGRSRRLELRLDTADVPAAAALAEAVGGVAPAELVAFADRLCEGAAPWVLYLSVDRDRRGQTNVYFRPGV